jgi:cytochrome c556
MILKKFKFIFALLTISLAGSLVSPTYASEDAIKYRQGVMKAIGGTMGSMGAILKGMASQKLGETLSDAMWQLSKTLKDLFPEDSDFGITRAKPEIWQKPAEFRAALTAFENAALNLSKEAHSEDPAAFASTFKALGKSCGGCHKPFRAPKS